MNVADAPKEVGTDKIMEMEAREVDIVFGRATHPNRNQQGVEDHVGISTGLRGLRFHDRTSLVAGLNAFHHLFEQTYVGRTHRRNVVDTECSQISAGDLIQEETVGFLQIYGIISVLCICPRATAIICGRRLDDWAEKRIFFKLINGVVLLCSCHGAAG